MVKNIIAALLSFIVLLVGSVYIAYTYQFSFLQAYILAFIPAGGMIVLIKWLIKKEGKRGPS